MNATTILVRRVKQGIAEWYRFQIKEKAWKRLREHALLREQLPASAAADAARRQKGTGRLRKRLRKIDTAEDAHVREVQALTELDPNSPAVKAMRERHLRAFTGLEAERDQINGKLAALAKQADDHGGDPALLDDLPILGDLLPKLPHQAKARLFEAFDLAMIYSKTTGQVISRATITPATPATLATIIADAEDPAWPPCSPAKIILRICHANLDGPDRQITIGLASGQEC